MREGKLDLARLTYKRAIQLHTEVSDLLTQSQKREATQRTKLGLLAKKDANSTDKIEALEAELYAQKKQVSSIQARLKQCEENDESSELQQQLEKCTAERELLRERIKTAKLLSDAQTKELADFKAESAKKKQEFSRVTAESVAFKNRAKEAEDKLGRIRRQITNPVI